MEKIKRLGLFRVIVILWLILLSSVSAIIIYNLLQVRDAAQTILAEAASELTEVAEGRIQYMVHISQTIPISTSIAINEEIEVPVSLVVKDTIPVKAEIPVKEEIIVPVDLKVEQIFPVDTIVPFKDTVLVPIDEVIYLNETFSIPIEIPGYGEAAIPIPIRANIPVKLDVEVAIDKQIPVKTDIPVSFPVTDELPVQIDLDIPVDMDIPINLPIETEVTVPFSRTIPINVEVPIIMDVPIDIAISETPFGASLQDLSDKLRQLTPTNSKKMIKLHLR
jgi:hypothetical protein